MDCYVYYRVSSHNATAARQAVAQLFALTAARFGASGRLQWRADTSANDTAAGTTTWMERYDNVGPAFVASLPSLAAESGLTALIEGDRHTECFVDAQTPCV
ncbi:hypothetical protein PHO31112_03615 [Pandoraea horticolens]|uniref:DUF4936 domain-containing protein n=1 Tax=Pandoraea horticolens TaxID=2508298 RepID=A0A5E4X2W2_9BURK|nr:DUF4936 family protein [Pandoraea horticolens]VVE30566.1 hypothetical protein PHO31112_03615 [Pandoraea horticolens]